MGFGTLCVVGFVLAVTSLARAAPPALTWSEVIATVKDREKCPVYAGLDLREHRDLVPLRRDPDSGLFEFLVKDTGSPPRLEAGQPLGIDEATGIVLVLIPAGTTQFGENSPPGRGDEHPQRTIELAALFIGKYEMTQGQWKKLTGKNPSEWAAGKLAYGKRMTLRHPVEEVTWDECRSALAKRKLVLPTEAQWERAARGGITTSWSFGSTSADLAKYANVHDMSAAEINPRFGPAEWDDGYVVTAPVGSFLPNPFGLYDVHGNVWEWCEDGYRSDAYTALEPRPNDGLQPMNDAKKRSIRSGSYFAPVIDSRCAERTGIPPGTRARGVGIRPARAVDPPK